MLDSEYFMRRALAEAEKAFHQGEVPIGSVIVVNDEVLAKGHNQVELLQDPTAHAEIIAIGAACQTLGSKFLNEATLYVTIEPCVMCWGALQHARIRRIVWGAHEPKYGFSNFVQMKHKIKCVSGVMAEECQEIMRSFFKGFR